MKKLINYFYHKMSNRTIKIVLFILLIYQFTTFLDVLKSGVQFNLYDIIIYQFNYISLFFMLSVAFLLIIYNISNNSKFSQYLILKFKNKKQYFNINVVIIVITAFLYVAFFNILSIVEGMRKSLINNDWSQFFLDQNTGSINVFFDQNNMTSFTQYITPQQYTVFLNILVFLYFVTLGLIFLMLNSLINKKQINLVIMIGIICLNMTSDSINAISRFTFTNNIFILTANKPTYSNYSFIYVRILYWFILILISYIIGLITTIRKDYNYGD